MRFVQLAAALLFLFCAAAATCAAQSTDSSNTDSATTDSPSRAAATYQRGMLALKKCLVVSARVDFAKVVRLSPQRPAGHTSCAPVLPPPGEIDSAIAHFPTPGTPNP